MTAINSQVINSTFEFSALEEAKHYRSALIREFSSALVGRVFEIGAGIGQMTALIRRVPTVAHLLAVEPDERFSAAFRLRNPEVPLHVGVAKSVQDEQGWDAGVSINVLEHIEHDALELCSWRRLLKGRAGRLCLFVPARPELYSELDRDFGHFRRYTKPGLLSLLESSGYRVERLSYFNVAGYFAWYFNFRLRRVRAFSPVAVRLFDKTAFRLSMALERHICRPPFGQSLVAVARAV